MHCDGCVPFQVHDALRVCVRPRPLALAASAPGAYAPTRFWRVRLVRPMAHGWNPCWESHPSGVRIPHPPLSKHRMNCGNAPGRVPGALRVGGVWIRPPLAGRRPRRRDVDVVGCGSGHRWRLSSPVAHPAGRIGPRPSRCRPAGHHPTGVGRCGRARPNLATSGLRVEGGHRGAVGREDPVRPDRLRQSVPDALQLPVA